jgi:ArsR family transcriptional regulator, arsenate/arsenite/antimonite-responsive transcriptional repressor
MTLTIGAPTALSALADPVRWRIVELLGDEQLCVCHLVDELEISQPLVSHHLKVLRDAGLVVGERYRYWTYYRVVPGALRALAATMQSLGEREPAGDRRPCC